MRYEFQVRLDVFVFNALISLMNKIDSTFFIGQITSHVIWHWRRDKVIKKREELNRRVIGKHEIL
jgi:hypothetical protein